jgi:threonylcarbamoyladenosine tRNA methylthiotransferase MtaB
MRVWLRTFGCRANQYDSEAIREIVERGGHTIAGHAGDADIAIFNSCAVTSEAVADLRQAIRRVARDNPRIESLVMGCASALPEADALRDLPNVTQLIDGADLDAVARALSVAPIGRDIRTTRQSGTRALLRIQDGCDEHCTFCATTIARGANRSRPINSLIDEAAILADHYSEIVITGIHIGTYGADSGSTLGTLMMRLVDAIPDTRFRLTSIEATEVDDSLLELMEAFPRCLAPSIHAPLQSGSDAVLRRMGRHWYSAAAYRVAVERMADRLPVFGLGADLISGFPGETDADHAATIAFVSTLPFTYLHVFPYSPRLGTAAIRLDRSVDPIIAQQRAKELRDVGNAKAAMHKVGRAGQVADVVVIGGGSSRRGLTEDYLEIDLVDQSLGRGQRVDAVLELRDGRLMGAVPEVAVLA